MNVQPLPTAAATFGSRLLHTPLFDLVRGRLTGSLDLRRVIAAAGLPQPVNDLIRRVARRTRLWRIERVDVARELAEHFRDGLAAGRTAEELIESFGDPRQAARLIRRAKLRSRPLFWRVWRRVWRAGVQALGTVAALMIASYLFFAVRLFSSHPTVAHNYRLELIAPTQSVPEADRAWPFYRAALLHITPEPLVADAGNPSPGEQTEASADTTSSGGAEAEEPSEGPLVPVDVAAEKPGGKHWAKVERWLDENQVALGAARQGAARSRFGFVYNDPADRAWLDSIQTDPKSIDPTRNDETLLATVLPQLDLRKLWRLWRADARRAWATNDRQTFLSDLRATIGLAEQLRGDQASLVFDLYSIAFFRNALALIDEALAERPELIDDDGLRDLAHRIASYGDGGRIELRLEGARLASLDLYQRAYSDNGRGDGVLTYEGFKLLNSLRGSPSAGRIAGSAAAPALAALIPSRRAMTELTTEYYDRAEHEFNRPLWQWTDSRFTGDMNQWQHSPIDQIRHEPLLMLMSGIPECYYRCELATQQRDATLVALALELYHRRHDAWPQHLSELVPDLLPAVPPDRFSGQPLGYRVVDGRPLVYSVGPDRKDDGGQRPDVPKDELAPLYSGSIWRTLVQSGTTPEKQDVDWDWVLWPPAAESPAPDAE